MVLLKPFTAGHSMYGDKGGNNPFGNTNTGGLYGAGRFGYSINNTQSLAYVPVSSSVDWYTDYKLTLQYHNLMLLVLLIRL